MKKYYILLLFFISVKLSAQKPNVIVFFVDDMGYSELKCYNENTDLITPNIDKIAQSGVICTDGYVTAPQCSPSRAGIITGYYQQRFGHEANPESSFRDVFGLDRNMLTLGNYMKGAGYKTGYVGKWDLGRQYEDNPEQRGFDYYYGAVVGARHYWIDNSGPYYMRTNLGHNNPIEETHYHTHQLTIGAQSFIEANKETPFFLFLSYTAPHSPFEATEESKLRNQHIIDNDRLTYAGMITSLDDDIGKIVQHLEDNKIAENTLIFFISDNGAPNLGPAKGNNLPLKGNKGDLYEGGIRIPFILNWARGGLPQGVKYSRPVSTLDILPTLLAAAGVESPADFPGVNLLPYLKGEVDDDPSEILFWRWSGQRAVRKGDWKWVSHPRDNNHIGLYNLHNDPYETTNLINTYPEKAMMLENHWREWNVYNMEAKWKQASQLEFFRAQYETNLPFVSFVSPLNQKVHISPASINVQVNVFDTSYVKDVKLYINEIFVGVDNKAPFLWEDSLIQLSNLVDGDYTLHAIATNIFGLTQSATMNFYVKQQDKAPMVEFVSPENEEKFLAPASLTVSISASDESRVEKVKLYINDSLVGEDCLAPFLWGLRHERINNLLSGNYTLKAVAIDDSNNSSEAYISFVVEEYVNDMLAPASFQNFVEVFPNPIRDCLNIKLLDGNNKFTTVQLYNSLGENVISQSFSQQEMSLELGQLGPGSYIVKVEQGKEVYIKHVLKN